MNSYRSIFNIINLLIFILLSANLSSQKLKDHKWPKDKPKHSEIPSVFEDEDLVCTYLKKSYFFSVVDPATWKTRYSLMIRKRVKIQTQEGLDRFTEVELTANNEYESIEMVDARTIKPNGKIIDLDVSDIKSLSFSSKQEEGRFKKLKFVIPGVEIGDEVELIYKKARTRLKMSGDIYFHSDMPVLESHVRLSIPTNLQMEWLTYNQLEQATQSSSATRVTLKWKLTNLFSTENDMFAQEWRELPYLSYVIRAFVHSNSIGSKSYPLVENEWGAIYKAYNQVYADQNFQFRKKGGTFNTFIEDMKQSSGKTDPIDQFEYIASFARNHFQLVSLDEEESNKPIGYFLDQKKIDNFNLHIFYRKVFEALKIKFYLCLSRNKYIGSIDRNLLAPGFVTDVFYAYSKDNEYSFVYPSDTWRTYELNELPYYLYDSNIYLVHGKTYNSLDLEVFGYKINPFTDAENVWIREVSYKLNSEEDNALGNFQDTYGGVLASLEKPSILSSISDENEEENPYKNPEIVTDEPYIFNIKYNSEVPIYMNKIDDGIYALKVDSLIDHQAFAFYEFKERNLGLYPGYKSTSEIKVNLEMPGPFNLPNAEDIEVKFENAFGTYKFKVIKLQNNIVQISSTYNTDQLYIPAGDFPSAMELYKKMKSSIDSDIIIEEL